MLHVSRCTCRATLTGRVDSRGESSNHTGPEEADGRHALCVLFVFCLSARCTGATLLVPFGSSPIPVPSSISLAGVH